MSVLAVIPAKGESRRIPGKNLRQLGGKPLVRWTIDAALAAETVTRTIVSTDSDEIADVALAAGAEVIRRPGKLCAPDAPAAAAVAHALEQADADVVVMLLPTSPFRTAGDIDECVRLHGATGLTVLSACEGWVFSDVAPGVTRRPVPNGAVWVASRSSFARDGGYVCELPYVMDPARGLDIDWPHQFVAAESLVPAAA